MRNDFNRQAQILRQHIDPTIMDHYQLHQRGRECRIRRTIGLRFCQLQFYPASGKIHSVVKVFVWARSLLDVEALDLPPDRLPALRA